MKKQISFSMPQLFNLKPISKFTLTKIRRRRKFGFQQKRKLGIRNQLGLPCVHHVCPRQPKSSAWSGGAGELELLHVPFSSSNLELIKVIKRRKLKKLFLHKSHTTHKHGSFIFFYFLFSSLSSQQAISKNYFFCF